MFGNAPSVSLVWNNLRSIGINFSLKILWNSALKPSGPRLFVVVVVVWETFDDCFYFFSSYRSI